MEELMQEMINFRKPKSLDTLNYHPNIDVLTNTRVTNPIIKECEFDLTSPYIENIPNSIIQTGGVLAILIDFPVKKPTVFVSPEIKPNYTLHDLINFVRLTYHQLYRDETPDKIPSEVPMIKGTYNRITTDGPYGIYGFHINNLNITDFMYIDCLGIWGMEIDC